MAVVLWVVMIENRTVGTFFIANIFNMFDNICHLTS